MGIITAAIFLASSVASDLMAPACGRRPREDLLLEGAKTDYWLRSQGEQSCMPSTAHRALFECITNMNQSWMTDSNHSLDMGSLARESRLMVKQPYQLYIERIAPEKNMARFYALAVQPTLFGEVSLVRAWGRIGTRGQQMVHLFDSESQAVSLFLDVLREKRKRGYRPKPPVDIELI